jgi:pyruvate/2-oxoglutarate dehydrogenase complex dihydrolipoamide dehydrogenase (E3) component
MFTHVAFHQAAIIAADILGTPLPVSRLDVVPRVTFTDPEVAAVGLGEATAREQGIEAAVALKNVPSTFRGWLHGSGNQGIIKLVIDAEREIVVGATVAAPHAGEVIGLLGLAIHERIQVPRLRGMIYAFPTFYGGVGEALGAYARGTGKVVDPAYATGGYLS